MISIPTPAGRCLSGGQSFAPRQVAGLQLWLKADGQLWQDSALTTRATADGDPVGGWGDASGNGRHVTQATSTKRPTLKLAVLSGKPVVRFDGVDDFLSVSLTQNQPSTYFIVVKNITMTANDYIFDGSGTGNGPAFYQRTVGGLDAMYAGATGPSPNAGTSDFKVFSLIFNGASSDAWMNGVEIGVANVGAANCATLTIGDAGGTHGVAANVDIAEFAVYSGALSDPDRQRIENYLAAHWSLY